jgi:hypothetical protein
MSLESNPANEAGRRSATKTTVHSPTVTDAIRKQIGVSQDRSHSQPHYPSGEASGAGRNPESEPFAVRTNPGRTAVPPV